MKFMFGLKTACVIGGIAVMGSLTGTGGFVTAAQAASVDRQITITGTGVIAAVPDMATLQLGIVTQGLSGKDALGENSKQMARVIADLAAAGIEERDIQTTGLSLQPDWDRRNDRNEPMRIVGYTARNGVTIRVRDLDILGDVLDDVVGSGANQFNGLSFGVINPAPLQDQARVLAVKNAAARAELLVTAAGAKLGDVLSISEQGAIRPQMMRSMAMDLAESSVPVAAGEVDLQANVTITYEIVD